MAYKPLLSPKGLLGAFLPNYCAGFGPGGTLSSRLAGGHLRGSHEITE
jgi:hypothetical protein